MEKLHSDVNIGLDRDVSTPSPISVDLSHLVRHVLALGSSGSGKTVFCKAIAEEVNRLGVPAICIDPQGDISSLGVLDDNSEDDYFSDLAKQYSKSLELVIFTPGSSRGVGISADPFGSNPNQLSSEDRIHAITSDFLSM